ncbi:MAG: hypothetical protein LBP74_06260 [Treponema sp.]|jgi:hypothetical protein|nr:hypothetical protein [Treponema sp.]
MKTSQSAAAFGPGRWIFLLVLLAFPSLFAGCDLYGTVGGADRYETVYELPDIFPGVWYSYYPYGDHYKTDGYRIGLLKDAEDDEELMARLAADFLISGIAGLTLLDGYAPSEDDYYVYYDDLSGGEWRFSYFGVVRCVNIFNGDSGAGAVIIEYFKETGPGWTDLSDTPFFGIYYRVKSGNTIQMANPIKLKDNSAVETAALDEAIVTFTPANEGSFIDWGVVLAQVRDD